MPAPDIRQAGVTLVELIVFIVVVSISVSGVLLAFSATQRGAITPNQLTQATQLAQQRMELILARKTVLSFACFTSPRFDPCQTAAAAGVCPATTASTTGGCSAPPTGYTISIPLLVIAGNDATITVTVLGSSGTQLAELKALVTNY
jgi:MSHA pilin protein MshD